ncbi:DUF6154 family protein [Metabacillus litoralis]|uniref:DUF6154 family protein n=1 Tax=Metabacillus TaxID=2675233 RepID=UPI000EF62258|nr:DUF6154 family protein [Metabacillus litoralis]MCM3164593.1 DUF6154 family protein [Metabacillus litoralis]MCM3410897.1 DUF6154 family protein [Metabacillus litoralis]
MNLELFTNPELSKFRADEEDVYAYVKSILEKTSKQDMLSWVNTLSEEDLHSLMIPYFSEKLSKELADRELE